MDRRERIDNPQEALIAAQTGWQAGIWTAMPAIVQTFNAALGTCTCVPTIQARVRQPDGTFIWVTMPVLLDVVIHYPGAGGWTLTFPLAPGDEVLVIFASRCIDAWWQSGGIQVQSELRMHDLSDGFAIPSIRSVPRKLPGGIATDGAQLRSDDGQNSISVKAGGIVRIEALNVQVHARQHYQWDVNGYGFGVTYAGGDTWNVHSWQTPRPGDTVNSSSTAISPPEGGP